MDNEIVVSFDSPYLVHPDTSEALWLDFYQGIIGSLAWPVVVLLAIWLFRRQLLLLLPDLDTLKVPGAEMSFKKRVAAVTEQAKEIETPDKEDAEANDDRLVHLVNMAAASPTGAILAAWKDLDAASKKLLERASQVLPYESNSDDIHQDMKASNILTSKMNTAGALHRYRLLPTAEIRTYEGLRQLKNRATHEPEGTISVEEARSYVRVADKLTDLIRGLQRKLEGPGYEF